MTTEDAFQAALDAEPEWRRFNRDVTGIRDKRREKAVMK